MNLSLNTTQPTTIGTINMCGCDDGAEPTTSSPTTGSTTPVPTSGTTPTTSTSPTTSVTSTTSPWTSTPAAGGEPSSSVFQEAVTKLLETFKEILVAFQQFLTRTGQPSSTTPSTGTSAPTGGTGTTGTTGTSGTTGGTTTTPDNDVKGKAPLTKVGEFLWKPQSDKDGKLAVLLPSSMTGKIKSVRVISPTDGRVLGTGKYSGVGNGNREHFRFTKAGDAYPDGSIVRVTTNTGAIREVPIKETSQRMTW